MRSAMFACLALTLGATPALAQREVGNGQDEVFELRIYHPAPGKLAALNARFR